MVEERSDISIQYGLQITTEAEKLGILKPNHERRGFYIVVDGLDGIGKGEVIRSLKAFEERQGRAVFDTISASKARRKGLPELSDFWAPPETYYDSIIVAEPTYAGIGHNIRQEIIARNGRSYTAEDEIQAYSLDRLMQLKRVIIPALQNGLNVISSRCCASTLTYQSVRAEDEGQDTERIRQRILAHAGNQLQLEWAPNLLIIPTIDNPDELMERLRRRSDIRKEDNAIFEDVKFQERLKPLFESVWLRKIFQNRGTLVGYIDAGKSVHETQRQAVEVYRNFLELSKN
ncbi:MAG: hypothetical protein KKD18_05750 [Nanoarchaeota archaeon]|nr:hypothetical protein [Nanoarchaeota archaeon]MBU0977894.1 hypothetical protein [Nanoarchaeota archaeon]